MKVIYEPGGAAKEYADLAINIYSGCTHGCRYCYVPACLRMKPADFHAEAVPRFGIVEAVAREAPKYAGDPREVLLSFTSDPYQPAEGAHHATRQVIGLLAANNVRISVLTKDPRRALFADSELLRRADVNLGTTLVFDNTADALEWEPRAPLPTSRMKRIRQAHNWGLRTWVSLEPVIKPEQSLAIIDELHDCIDVWKVGKLNHHRELEAKIDWRDFHRRVIEKLDGYGSRYVIKNDLLKAAGQI
ncbi:MAG: hypothetical protein ABIF82_00825 [Planctomycetota bacterium]